MARWPKTTNLAHVHYGTIHFFERGLSDFRGQGQGKVKSQIIGIFMFFLSWNSTGKIGRIGQHLAEKPNVKVTMPYSSFTCLLYSNLETLSLCLNGIGGPFVMCKVFLCVVKVKGQIQGQRSNVT